MMDSMMWPMWAMWLGWLVAVIVLVLAQRLWASVSSSAARGTAVTGIEAVESWSSTVAAFALSLAAIGIALPGSASEPGANTDGSTEPARGQVIYQQHCARCHGSNLEGEPDWRRRKPNGRLPAPPHDHTGHTWHHSDDALFRVTKFGSSAVVGGTYESDMPGFEKVLGDDDISAVIAFIKSRWPEDIRKRQENMTRRTQR